MSDTTTSGSTIVCSECGSANEEDATFCGACGAYLEWDGQRMGPPEPEPEVEEEEEPPPPPEKLTLLERVKQGLGLDGEAGGSGAADGLGAAEAAEVESEIEQPQQDAQPEQPEQPRPAKQREHPEPPKGAEPHDQTKPSGAAAEPERPADRVGTSGPSAPSGPSETSQPAKSGEPAAPEAATPPAKSAAEATAASAAAAAAAAAALVARPPKPAEQAGKAGTKAPSTTSAKTAATTASAKGSKPGGAKATSAKVASAKAAGAPQARKPSAAAPQARKPGAEAQPRQPAAVKPGAEANLTGRRKVVPVDEYKPKPGETICGQCGAGNAPERRFCRRCGHDLEGAAVMSPLPWWRRIFQRRHKTITAGTRPVRRRKRKWPRRLITVAVILGILYAIAWYALPHAGGPIDALRDRIQGTERFEPSELVASSSSRGRGPQLARDGRLDTSWAPAPPGQGVGQYLEARFDEPFRLVAVQIFNGGSRKDDVYLKSGRPQDVTFTITKSDGTVETRDVSLRDDPDQQDIILGINDVETVRMTVKSSVGSTATNHINLGEMAFFTRS